MWGSEEGGSKPPTCLSVIRLLVLSHRPSARAIDAMSARERAKNLQTRTGIDGIRAVGSSKVHIFVLVILLCSCGLVRVQHVLAWWEHQWAT